MNLIVANGWPPGLIVNTKSPTLIRRSGRGCWRTMVASFGLLIFCATAVLAADSIRGTVHNQTVGQVATGDEVQLLHLDHANQTTQVEARTRTDSHGAFTFSLQHPESLHLVRVLHQGVNYDRRASAGDNLSVDVFDVAGEVPGIRGSIEIIRTGTKGNLLHVSDMVEVRNDSRPPLTQVGDRTFEAYLPAQAKIDSVLAACHKVGMLISAARVAGEPGHFKVSFPLRPGATKFAFNYDLRYQGHATFRTRIRYPLQQLAVMVPATMKFSSRSSVFQLLPTGSGSYLVEAASEVNAGNGPEFEISGIGELPALQAQPQSPPKPKVAALPAPALSTANSSGTRTRSASALTPLSATALSPRSSQVQWWLLGAGVVFVLGAGGFLLGRRDRLSGSPRAVQRTRQAGRTSTPALEVLQEELSRLEIDRSQGAISREEYVSAKQALEGTVKRALARVGANT